MWTRPEARLPGIVDGGNGGDLSAHCATPMDRCSGTRGQSKELRVAHIDAAGADYRNEGAKGIQLRGYRAGAATRTASALGSDRECQPLGMFGSTARSGPARLRQHFAQLQRMVGNQAVLRILNRSGRGDGQPVATRPFCADSGLSQAASPTLIQPKLTVSKPGDQYEQEADRVAEQVMGMSEAVVQRSGATGSAGGVARPKCEEKKEQHLRIDRKPYDFAYGVGPSVADGFLSNLGRGQPLDSNTRGFMENRFVRDFSGVRVHTDSAASASARALNANAYTLGHDIVFGAGRYQPNTEQGKRLVAHELTHVLQQQAGGQAATIQRDCSDPDFCTPYPTAAEAASTKAWLRSYYLPIEEAKFSASTRGLYASYLSRHPGDSLTPVEFNVPASDVVSSFAESWATADDQDAIIDLIGARLSRAPGGQLNDNTPTIMSIENFLSHAEMDNRPINYSNPFSIAGHIAGGIGSSDAGPDYRKVWGNVELERTPLIGSTGYERVETTLHYEVFDAVDFCPGDCGSPAEQLITVPMSRLEASGEAYDVPFKVTFVPESRSKRFFYS